MIHFRITAFGVFGSNVYRNTKNDLRRGALLDNLRKTTLLAVLLDEEITTFRQLGSSEC